MTYQEKSEAYRNFFIESAVGREFMNELERLVTNNHEQAEDDPELSRDYMQRAKGNREVLQHIQSVTTELKKGKVSK